MSAPPSTTPKPTDLGGVAEHLRHLLSEGQQEEVVQVVLALLGQMVRKNSELELRLLKLLRQRFGRTSEKVSAEQLSLFLAELERQQGHTGAAPEQPAPGTQPTAPEPAAAELSKPQPRKGHGRRPLPPHLPREEHVHQPPAEALHCATCGRDKTRCGEERSQTLEWVPGHFKVVEDVRPKYACRGCGEGMVVVAPPADKVIEGGLPGPGLLAHVLVSKYKSSLPLHRLSGIFARQEVHLRPSTLSDWVAASADCLQPLANEVARRALASHVLQSDDTSLKVLDRDHPNGVRRGRMWVYLGDKQWAAFVYTPDWKQEGPQSFLDGREGWLLVDGYRGYDKLFTREGATAVEVGCWSHARRYFIDALEAGDVRAAVAVKAMRELFAVERLADEQRVDEAERLRRRQETSRPVLEELEKWLRPTYEREPPRSPLAEACRYALNQWTALGRFLEDAKLPLHNNASELRLREIAVGRKNWMFAGSDAGAQRAACVYTLVATCVLAGVEPWAYLADVLRKLAAGWPQRRIAELLPPMWKAAREQDTPAAT